MNLAAFEAEVERVWTRIPNPLKHDVVALVVEPNVQFDPEFPDTLRLGECMIEPAIAHVPEAPVRSLLYIYYGSFVAAAAREPDFDWIAEIEETVHHELRHHLDWREGHDSLGLEDDLERENMLRLQGQPFDRSFYQLCTEVAPGVTRLGPELFVEIVLKRRQWSQIFERSAQIEVDGVTLTGAAATASERRFRIVFVPVVDYLEPEGMGSGTASEAQRADPEAWRIATIVFRRRFWFDPRGSGPLQPAFVDPVAPPPPGEHAPYDEPRRSLDPVAADVADSETSAS